MLRQQHDVTGRPAIVGGKSSWWPVNHASTVGTVQLLNKVAFLFFRISMRWDVTNDMDENLCP